MFGTSVPSWFGPSRPLQRDSDVVVDIRPRLAANEAKSRRRRRNGWHYDAPDSRLMVEAVSYREAATHFEAWNDLTLRLIEPNVFLEPSFVLPAVQHFALARHPVFLLVWDETGGPRASMIGLCPILLPRHYLGGSIARSWMHDQAALGTPLIDRARAIETLDLMLDWLHRENPGITSLMFPNLRQDGPMLALLRDRAILTGRELRLYDGHQRAMLSGAAQGEAAMAHALSPKKLKDLRRLRRRLAECGELVHASARTPADVRDAAERFLAMEAAGWKGQRGTALLADPSLTTFLRTMTRLLARDGKCRIDTLSVGGKPAAMGIILQSGGYAYLWKIAYDESFAINSPGVQFVLDLTRAQLAEEGIIFTDSCAIACHPMIDHVWRERLAIADALVSARQNASRRFAMAAAGEAARRRLRRMAKTMFYRILKRKAS